MYIDLATDRVRVSKLHQILPLECLQKLTKWQIFSVYFFLSFCSKKSTKSFRSFLCADSNYISINKLLHTILRNLKWNCKKDYLSLRYYNILLYNILLIIWYLTYWKNFYQNEIEFSILKKNLLFRSAVKIFVINIRLSKLWLTYT